MSTLHPSTNPISWASIHPDVWQADALAGAPERVLTTGDALLDAQLPGGGWPLGALSEILQPDGMHSEWRLLLPTLSRSGSGSVVLVGAPHMPFGPALDAQGVHPDTMPALGEPLAGWVRTQTELQDLVVESALQGDPELALQAVIRDPNSPADERACRAMFDELMALQAPALPF